MIDIGLLNRLIFKYGYEKVTFTFPIVHSTTHLVIKRHPNEIPRIFYHITGAFDATFTMIYILTTCIFIAIMKAQNRQFELSLMILHVVGVSSSVSVPMSQHIRNHQRITFSSLLLLSVIVCGAYQGCIVEKLTSRDKFREMQTLQELAQSDYSISTVNHNSLLKSIDGGYVNKVYADLDKKLKKVALPSDELLQATMINTLDIPHNAFLSELNLILQLHMSTRTEMRNQNYYEITTLNYFQIHTLYFHFYLLLKLQ